MNFENIPGPKQKNIETEFAKNADSADKNEWLSFIESTYGCLSDDPIKRGEQGEFEIREKSRAIRGSLADDVSRERDGR